MTRRYQDVCQAVVQWESRTRSHEKVEPPRDPDMVAGGQTISRRAIRTVHHLGDLRGHRCRRGDGVCSVHGRRGPALARTFPQDRMAYHGCKD